MKAKEIRQSFLDYFKKNGHTIVESSSLIPQNDPTLLFTNAGMVQFKDVFLGKETRPYRRATSSQKCIRAGGKHNDLENVGFTSRHHTFFEMLGNFSFGDYFKKEAIHFAWEFVTKELGLPKNKLYVSVYKDDAEAAEIWHKQEGVPKERIYRFGEKDNFWAMGETGPCGPCSELFIDRGEKVGCKKKTCDVGCDCDRYLEFWNLVFMQFNRSADGTLTPLPKPSVDTGAGLERLAAILQKVDGNYETDIFVEIISKTKKILGLEKKKLDADQTASLRVIADHSRAATFLIADGVLPSNEGRGYVLRRILRRAIRHGKKLGRTEPFLFEAASFVVEQMKDAYPDLQKKKDLVQKSIQAEEDQFLKTLERGLSLLEEATQGLKGKKKTLSGETAFKLYDTYGFPLDLTRVICAEQGLEVDEAGFEKLMGVQKETSRKNWKGSGEQSVGKAYFEILEKLKQRKEIPEFLGYETLSVESKCVALLAPNAQGELEEVSRFSADGKTSIQALFKKTPFYGESGGQVGDIGTIEGNGFKADVTDVQKPIPELIVAHLKPLKGKIEVGQTYSQHTQEDIRRKTASNHTATHLLHWALREVLGTHVQQAGSLVSPELLRFDFSHFQALTEEQLQKIEDRINAKIWKNDKVSKKEMKKEEALAKGAIAFFGEKYGDLVRVVSVGDFSTELCGGTHVDEAAEIGLFKIGSESGIAAGVRRIIAYTSQGAFEFLRKQQNTLKTVQQTLKASHTDEILGKVEHLIHSEKELRREVEKFKSQSAGGEVEQLLGQVKKINGTSLISAVCQPDPQGIKRLREISDRIKQKIPEAVIVLGMKEPDQNKAFLLVTVGPSAPKEVQADKLIQKLAPLIEGRGGGRADMAQAGGTNPSGLQQALDSAHQYLH